MRTENKIKKPIKENFAEEFCYDVHIVSVFY